MKYIKIFESDDSSKNIEDNLLLDSAYQYIKKVIEWVLKEYKWLEEYYTEDEIKGSHLKCSIHFPEDEISFNLYGMFKFGVYKLKEGIYHSSQGNHKAYWDVYNDEKVPIIKIGFTITIGSNKKNDNILIKNNTISENRYKKCEDILNTQLSLIKKLKEKVDNNKTIDLFEYHYPNFVINHKLIMDIKSRTEKAVKKLNR